MNYTEMGEKYSAEAERLKERIELLKKRQPKARWEAQELRRAIDIMDTMYYDCLLAGKYLKNRGSAGGSRL